MTCLEKEGSQDNPYSNRLVTAYSRCRALRYLFSIVLSAIEAIRINLSAYKETGQSIPPQKAFATHFENADYEDLLFAFVHVTLAEEQAVA
jgi:hypothetical protein